MTNTALFKKMIEVYDALSFAHMYIWGFIDRGNVYMIITDNSVLPYIAKLDKASRGAGYSLRFRPTRAQKELLKTYKSTVLCSVEYFNELVNASKYNKGEIFEKLVTEKCGQVWHKDSVPFTQDGDITIKDIAFQIKFQSATFCNEKTLANLS